VAEVQATSPEAQVAVWATADHDEQRVGLNPIVGRVWARKGQRPIVRVQHCFQWRDVLAFVHPASGRSAWQFASAITTAVMSVALESFAATMGTGPTKRIVLVLDRAGWHSTQRERVPEHVHFLFLPPSSPELQPAERLWPLTNAPVLTRHLASIDDLEQAPAARCVAFQAQPALIRSTTLFPWWLSASTNDGSPHGSRIIPGEEDLVAGAPSSPRRFLDGSALIPDPLQPPGHSRRRIGGHHLGALLGLGRGRSSKDHRKWGSCCSLGPHVGQRFCEITCSERLAIRFLCPQVDAIEACGSSEGFAVGPHACDPDRDAGRLQGGGQQLGLCHWASAIGPLPSGSGSPES
jgi:hypothetical protein